MKNVRIRNNIRKYAWTLVVIIAFGGLYFPVLGLLLVPIMLGLPVMGFKAGKFWCGNICPHGSLFDLFLHPISRENKVPSFMKGKIFKYSFFSLFMYMMISRLIFAFNNFSDFTLVEKVGAVFATNYLVVTLIGIITGLLINSRTWCHFCPMGTFQDIFNKLGKGGSNIEFANESKCVACKKCINACPMGLEVYQKITSKEFEDKCIKCQTCVFSCPTNALIYKQK